MFAYHPEEVLYTGEADPSPYELAMEQRRMERKMKQQVKKYGEEAMRSELKQEFDAAVPTEGFQRSVVLKGEGGSNRSKANGHSKRIVPASVPLLAAAVQPSKAAGFTTARTRVSTPEPHETEHGLHW